MAFNFLKKLFGKSEQKPAMPKELASILDKIRNDMFPGGSSQMEKELNEVASIIGVSPSRIRETFTYACSRAFMGCDRETLIFGIQRHDEALSYQQVNDFAKYIFKKQFRQQSGIDNEMFLEMQMKGFGFIEGDIYDVIPGAFGEFGICKTNPVPVNGIPANDRYVNRLRTLDGSKIKFERQGSMSIDSIEGPIDIYNITDESGRKLPTIYISSYHASTSKLPPTGYKFG